MSIEYEKTSDIFDPSFFELEKSHYDVLNLNNNASNKEIRESYFKLKKTYSSSSQALYSMVDDCKLDETLVEIETAYKILSNAYKRQEYDRNQIAEQDPCMTLSVSDNDSNEANLIESNFRGNIQNIHPSKALEEPDNTPLFMDVEEIKDLITDPEYEKPPEFRTILNSQLAKPLIAKKSNDGQIKQKISDIIKDHDLDDGSLYKRIRQAVGVSKQQMQENIKISIVHIESIEENHFDFLPQPVYVKGFLKAYLRFLGVKETDTLVTAYIERFKEWMDNKSKNYRTS